MTTTRPGQWVWQWYCAVDCPDCQTWWRVCRACQQGGVWYIDCPRCGPVRWRARSAHGAPSGVTRVCTGCGVPRPLSAFRRCKWGYTRRCAACRQRTRQEAA